MPKHKFFSSQQRQQPHRQSNFDPSSFDLFAVYENYVEDLRQTSDDWAWGCCPFHDDNNPSFCVNLRSGFYLCKSSSCGVRGGLVSFVSALLSLETREAIRYLEENHG
jgi:DNA primase